MKWLFGFSLLFCSVVGWAQSLKSENELKAGLFNIVPYAYIENEEVKGITADIVSALALEAGTPISSELLPYSRMLRHLELGQVDFSVFFLSDQSAAFSDALIPLYQLDTIIVGVYGQKIEHLNDLKGLMLATPIGVDYNENLADDEQLDIVYVRDYSHAIKMLKRGYVNAIIGPKRIIEHQLSLLNLSLLDLGEPFVLTTNTAWLQFSHQSKHLNGTKETLINASERLLEQGIIDDIIDRYYQ